MLRRCSDKCVGIYNKSKFDEADAIVFFPFMMKEVEKQLPAFHKPSQIWLLYSLEPPTTTSRKKFSGKQYGNFFNWTLTYRRDSDFWLPYTTYKVRSATKVSSDYAKGKTKLAVAFISNCNKRRMTIVKKLSEHLPVDIYGSCGNKGRVCKTGNSKRCMSDLLSKYKFYLAFENSRCKYYITEKYRRAVEQNLLPIVWGPDEKTYKEIAIPDSYIHVDSFSSIGSLATYVKRLDGNDTLYNQYFKWKSTYKPSSGSYYKAWCSFCSALHSTPIKQKTYTDFETWWEGSCY